MEHDNMSDISDPSGPFFAIWGSLTPDHQKVTTTEQQASLFAKFFVRTLTLPLTHITEHRSRMSAEMFLATQTPDIALSMKMDPSGSRDALFIDQLAPELFRPSFFRSSASTISLPTKVFSHTTPMPEKSIRSVPALFSAPTQFHEPIFPTTQQTLVNSNRFVYACCFERWGDFWDTVELC